MKICIFFDQEYPRKGPDSNYVHYLALAFESLGYQVLIIGESITMVTDIKIIQETKGIFYTNISMKNKAKRYLCRFITYKDRFNYLGFDENDIFVFYTEYGSKIKTLLKKVKVPIKNRVLVSVEYMQAFYPLKFPGLLRYLRYKYFEYISKVYVEKVMTISRNLYECYLLKGYMPMILPVMTNSFGINLNDSKIQQKVSFIYSGIDIEKEDYLGMFITMNYLKKRNNNIRFIITNSDSQIIRKLIGNQLYSSLESILKIYSWLPYEKYIQILSEANFLLTFRKKNIITESNMPSKVPEALSRGIIPIISNGGELSKYYLTDLTDSIILEGGNYEEYATKIEKVIVNPDLFYSMRQAAYNLAKNRFDYYNWSSKIDEFIKR